MSSRRRISLIVLGVVTIAGATVLIPGSPTRELAHQLRSAECLTTFDREDGRTLAAFGDSVTASESNRTLGVQSRGSWYSHLVCSGAFADGGNHGVPAETSAQVLKRLRAECPDVDVLVVQAGTNDLRLSVPTETTLTNLKDAVDTAQGCADIVVITTVQPWPGTDAASLNRSIRDLAEREGVVVADFATVLAPADRTQDGVHPTEAAAVLLADEVAAVVPS